MSDVECPYREPRTSSLCADGLILLAGGAIIGLIISSSTTLYVVHRYFTERRKDDAPRDFDRNNKNTNHNNNAFSLTWTQQVVVWLGRQCHLSLIYHDGNGNTSRHDYANGSPHRTRNDDPTTNNGSHSRTLRAVVGRDASTILEKPTIGDSEATSRLRENLELIHSVLDFWFDHESIDEAQKKLWMVSQQNVTLRNQVDADIAANFGCILVDLASTSSRLHEWCHETNVYGTNGILAAIIVLDQFSRHVHRFVEQYRRQQQETSSLQNGGTVSSIVLDANHWTLLDQQLPAQAILDNLAYETSLLIERPQLHTGTGSTKGSIAKVLKRRVMSSTYLWTVPMRIFALMPHRHASTLDSVEWTRNSTEKLAQYQCQCGTMIAAFRKATHRRLAVLHDDARRTGATTTSSPTSSSGHQATEDTTDRPRMDTEFNDILECGPFCADMTHAQDHVVHRTIREFLATVGIRPHMVEGPTSNRGNMSTVAMHNVPIVVSLSGGVDSMVIVAVLAHLKQACGYSQLHIVAAHIDYANRPESHAEATFVQQYCHEYCYGAVDFTVRRIDEVTRGITARDDYERKAREIRYAFYRDTVQICRSTCIPSESNDPTSDDIVCSLQTRDIGVVLGHHRGDLRENVLSNAHKGSGPLDLSGMTKTSYNDGVSLYRPLLSLEKSAIFDYAHKYGVPYFKDTTPHWSTRGKLRNKLVPLLEEIYGEGSMNNLSNLAVESDACRALLQNLLIQPFMDQIVYKPMGIYFPTSPWKEQGTFFWNLVLREALHSAGLGMFTDKSVESFMKRACCHDSSIREGWLQCRKDYAVYLRADGYIFVFYPQSFPWHKNDYYSHISDQTVSYGADHSITVGPWAVLAEIYPEESQRSQDDVDTLLNRKALVSMESFMEGHVEYYMRAPAYCNGTSGKWSPRPLVFTSFVKQNRPRAWKNVDTKIQDTLPLLGNDATACKALDDMGGQLGSDVGGRTCCVRVTLRVTDFSRR